MIKNNSFYIENLKNVVFLGFSQDFSNLLKINKLLKLNSIIITSTHQSNLIQKKIDYKVFDKLNDKFKKYLKSKIVSKNTLFCSLSSRYIFKKNMINNFFLNNIVNFHRSRLPLDAGGGGMSWRIMREDRIDCQLVHLVDEGIDTGPIIDFKNSLFPKSCQIPIDFEKIRLDNFIKFYESFIKKIKQGKQFLLKPQMNTLGRYNPRLNTEVDGIINWDLDSYDLYNFINAFDEPYKGAFTFINNKNFGKLHLKSVHLHGGDSSNHPFCAGICIRNDGNWIVVSTKSKHMLLIEKVIDRRGENIMSKIKPGDRFFSPLDEINKSKSTRTLFNSLGLKN